MHSANSDDAVEPDWDRIVCEVRDGFVNRIRADFPADFNGKISARDVVDSGIAAAATRLSQYRGNSESQFYAWVWTIIINKLREKIRRFKTEGRDISRELSAEPNKFGDGNKALTPLEAACVNELISSVRECIDGLQPETRVALVKLGLEGLSRREAAELLGVSEGTVAGRYRRGLAALEEPLKTIGESWFSEP